MLKVVLTDNENKPVDIEREVLGRLEAELVYLNTLDKKKIITFCKDADAIMCTYAKIDSEVIKNLQKCKVIARYGSGVDNVDIDFASKAGILVANLPDYAVPEVSNHTIALILALNRKLLTYDYSIRRGLWGFKIGVPIPRLNDLVLGLVGFGNIGQCVAKKAQCLGLKVVSFDPNISNDFMNQSGVEKINTIENLLIVSDVVSLHLPLNKSTKNMVKEKELKLMKRSSLLINCSRGGIVNEKALIKALKEKWISGAGIDVFEQEPINSDNELLKLNNVILTPHSAYYSEDAQKIMRYQAAEAVADVLQGRYPRSIFNKSLLVEYGKINL